MSDTRKYRLTFRLWKDKSTLSLVMQSESWVDVAIRGQDMETYKEATLLKIELMEGG